MTPPRLRRVWMFILVPLLAIGCAAPLSGGRPELPNITVCPPPPYAPGDDPPPQERDFTRASAEFAVEQLGRIVSGEGDGYEWFTFHNLMLAIEGYVLRRDALIPGPESGAHSRSAFCGFMERAASYD